MREPVGVAVIGAAAALLVAVAAVGPRRLRPRAVDALLAVAGAGLGLGGLLLLEDVGLPSWVAAPLVLAVLTPLHVRALLAGDGPLRV
ncbi:MAG: hypothetical protein KatS3mg013_1568 [Actinomycetota bacterium]|jgi:hypothetical protein|nr:MAG: hypothetical protein KatS3mg013_1568 [Actinomycetota bacterium]